MPHIFISYRRSDRQAITGRLYDRLGTAFGRDHVFLDVNTISVGADFRSAIITAIQECQVFIVVIGKNWLEVDESNTTRLSRPDDYVRMEIEVGMQKSLSMCPILVDGAMMPDRESLPSSIERLAFFNAININSGPDFGDQVNRLIRNLTGLLPNIASAFVDRVTHLQASRLSSDGTKRSVQALRELYESLAACHTAYLSLIHI